MSKKEVKELSEKRQSTHEELTDLVVDGFKRLDNNILDKRPPKIKWLEGFDRKETKVKIEYLKKLASTMNNAARLIQDERDKLVQLMVLKEKQLGIMSKQMIQNNMVVQNQVTVMNTQRQGFNKEVSRLNQKVKSLELENKELKKDKEE